MLAKYSVKRNCDFVCVVLSMTGSVGDPGGTGTVADIPAPGLAAAWQAFHQSH